MRCQDKIGKLNIRGICNYQFKTCMSVIAKMDNLEFFKKNLTRIYK